MLSDVLFAIDNPMNMENFLCTATYRITVVYWRVSFSPPCIITFCKFTSLVQMLECGCVGVRMFDASYMCFFALLSAAIHCRLLKWLIHTYPSKHSTEDGWSDVCVYKRFIQTLWTALRCYGLGTSRDRIAWICCGKKK